MSKNKELIKNTIILFLGKTCTQLITFILLPIYTSILSTEDYGFIDLVTTYIVLLVPIITLQLEGASFRFLIDERDSKERTKIILSNIIYMTILLSFIGIIIYFIFSTFMTIKFKYYLLGCIVTTIFSNILLQILRGIGDNKGYSICSIIAGVTSLISNIIFLMVFKLGVLGILISMIMSNLLCSICLIFREKIWQYIDFKLIDKKVIKSLLKYSLPLMPNGIIWWIINVSDRTIISLILGTAANGIYAVSNKFSAVFINIYNIFNMSWTESASIHINANDRDEFFTNTFDNVIKIFGSLGILIIAVMPIVFPIMINEEYTESYIYIPYLIVASLFNCAVSFLGAIYIAKKLTKEVAITSVLSGIINIIVNVILIRYIGIIAAAISTIVAFLIMTIYRLIDVQKYVKLKINKKTLFMTAITYFIIIVLYMQNNINCNIGLIILSIVYILLINLKMIKNINTELRKKIWKK